ncbi:MAG: autotransporter domain-containing protein, partial [Sphingomonadaceae bacterium]
EGTANFPVDFVSIIINTNDLASLFVNGVQADASLFQPLSTTALSFGNIEVSGISGPFSITAASPFQLLLSGFDSFDSYFTYGGAAFSPGASPPPEEPPPPPPSETVTVWWDGDAAGNPNNGVVDGGDGVLTRTSGNLTTADGATNSSLPVEPANIIFAGQPGTVQVDTSEGIIAVAGMEFRVSGYTITGDPVVLASDGAAMRVGNGTPAGADFEALIEAELVGAGRLTKTDLGTLVLTASNSYAGGTTVAAGTLVGHAGALGTGNATVAEEATLVFDQATAGTFEAAIGGAGSLVKRGAGTLELSGSSGLTGGTTVEAGRLNVTGTLADSAVAVLAGATLGGTGTVGSTLLAAGSRIAPGLSIGTLTVDGDIAFGSGSTYEVELLSTGESDRIVASGAAAIAAGANLQVVKLDAPRFVLGQRYTVLTAAGGRSGTFTLSGPLRVSQFISVVGEYDANNAYLAVRQTSSFASAGATPNQIAAASGADNAGNGLLYLGLAYLPDAPSAQAAFDQISGEIHASARGIALEDSRFVREAVASRLLATQEEGMALWGHGFGAKGSWDGDGNAADLDRHIAGLFLGADFIATSGVRAGILGGFANGAINVPARGSVAETTDFHLGGYGAFGLGGGFAAHVGVAHMWRTVETARTIAFPGYADSLGSKYNLGVTQVFADVGYRLDVASFGLEPFANLAWVKVNESDFRENGGPAALRTAGNDSSDYFVTTVGGRVYVGLPVGAGNFGAMGSLGWRHVAGDDVTTPLAMQFNAGNPFFIAGVPVARDAAALGFAIQGRVGKLELDIGYSGVIGGGVSDHGGRATAIFRF